jgi:hypothetical protein
VLGVASIATCARAGIIEFTEVNAGKWGGGEESHGLHYLRQNTPVPSISTISAETPCFAR